MLTSQTPINFQEIQTELIQQLQAQFMALASGTGPQIIRAQISIAVIDPLSWLEAQEAAIKFYWRDRAGEFTIAAIGSSHEVKATHETPSSVILARLHQILKTAPENVFYWGGLAFYPKDSTDILWQEYGQGRFILPMIELKKTSPETVLSAQVYVDAKGISNLNTVIELILQLKSSTSPLKMKLPQPNQILDDPSQSVWIKNTESLLKDIKQGKFEKVVLARKLKISFSELLNPFQVMRCLEHTADNCYRYIIQFTQGQQFLGITPERLFSRCQNKISTEAIAGTKPLPQWNDAKSKVHQSLLESPKELKEQDFVVEMISQALAKICLTVDYAKFPSLLSLNAGCHLITRFEGILKRSITDQEILNCLHPTPAVAGTPTNQALAVIHSLESFDRGWYGGPIGIIAKERTDLAVALRCGILNEKELHLFAGAGIISESKCDAEWQETQNKLNSIFRIFLNHEN